MQHGGDFLPGKHKGQDQRFGDADFGEDRPVRDAMAIDEEGAQAELGRLHGGTGVVLFLAEEEELLAQLILGESEGVAAEMFGALADVADVFLFGERPVIFEFDKLLEF